ncbi:sel1 repeat family protein [Albimonas pacifica]|uniref:Sel1 repeat-containing protein n=1 Tax=Albimonas pacifica TaxID=1114924 RepID=A0A1I3D1Z9_9RHOB|nr:sel1 repeat family protein [Albimonas pacifica]SFH80727.1 hypothetical protein SAMN05216258_102340 [Albimonas pacifica]
MTRSRPLRLALVAALVLAGPAAARAPTDAAGLAFAADPVADCDRLAAWATDPQREAAPVAGPTLSAEPARAACTAAVAERPDLPRLRFQLARALWRLGDQDIAYALLEQAAQQGSPAAYLVIGSLFEAGEHVRQDDVVALLHYLEAARRGAPEGLKAAAGIWGDPQNPSHDARLAATAQGALDPRVIADW